MALCLLDFHPPTPGPLFCPLVPGCLPPTCMSRGPSNDPGTLELSVSLAGGVKVTITAPSSAAVLASQVLNHVAAFQPESSDPSEFELVSGGSVSPTRSVPVRVPETRDQVRRSLLPCPGHLFGLSSRLCGSSLSGRARIERAWTCGQWVAAVQASRIHSPDRTPAIDLRNRYYAVLRAPGLSVPTIFQSSAGYWACIRSLEDSDAISQAFPSETEAKIYLQAAGVVDPTIAP